MVGLHLAMETSCELMYATDKNMAVMQLAMERQAKTLCTQQISSSPAACDEKVSCDLMHAPDKNVGVISRVVHPSGRPKRMEPYLQAT